MTRGWTSFASISVLLVTSMEAWLYSYVLSINIFLLNSNLLKVSRQSHSYCDIKNTLISCQLKWILNFYILQQLLVKFSFAFLFRTASSVDYGILHGRTFLNVKFVFPFYIVQKSEVLKHLTHPLQVTYNEMLKWIVTSAVFRIMFLMVSKLVVNSHIRG